MRGGRMIENDIIITYINGAIDCLNTIKYAFERDGFVSKDYVMEKVGYAKNFVKFVMELGEE